MTREELINHIKYAIDIGADITLTNEDGEEIIRALEQEPYEDAISRQAVLDATVKRNSIWNKITNSKGENLEEIISQLPPVTPKGVTVTDFADRCRECGKMRKGHWVVDREAFRLNIRGKQTFDYSVHCDKCDYRCDYTTDVKGSSPSNYCPNCGAKMIEPQESEE